MQRTAGGGAETSTHQQTSRWRCRPVDISRISRSWPAVHLLDVTIRKFTVSPPLSASFARLESRPLLCRCSLGDSRALWRRGRGYYARGPAHERPRTSAQTAWPQAVHGWEFCQSQNAEKGCSETDAGGGSCLRRGAQTDRPHRLQPLFSPLPQSGYAPLVTSQPGSAPCQSCCYFCRRCS